MKYYVAYGSNLNKEQMKHRCPCAKPLGTTNLVGYRLLFKGSKTGFYLTIEEDPQSIVPVAIWGITSLDEDSLDRYEGYPRWYYKKYVYVYIKGLAVKAMVYIMYEDCPVGIPSDYYVNVCREGYRDFSLDEYYLDKALRESKEAVYETKVS